jgi:hypothetical protein
MSIQHQLFMTSDNHGVCLKHSSLPQQYDKAGRLEWVNKIYCKNKFWQCVPLCTTRKTPLYKYRQRSIYGDLHYEILLTQIFIVKRIPAARLIIQTLTHSYKTLLDDNEHV